MALSSISTAARNAMCDAFVDLLDDGDLQVRTAGGTTLLATCDFSATAFGSASTGTATANAIAQDSSADATGTAAVVRMRNSAGATQADGTVGVGSGDLQLNTTSITAGDVVVINSATITMPAS